MGTIPDISKVVLPSGLSYNLKDATARATLDTKANLSLIADEYSSSSTYQLGSYCMKDGNLYRCTTKISTAEAWNSEHWSSATKIGTELTYLLQNMIYYEDFIT